MRSFLAVMLGVLACACSPTDEMRRAPGTAGGQAPVSGPAYDADCPELPEAVRRQVDAVDGWRVLSFEDLVEDDKALWRQLHPKACPGMVKARLQANGPEAYAVALLSRAKGPREEQLVVFLPTGAGYERRVLSEPGHVAFPAVVWTAPAGTYQDLETGRELRSEVESIGYEAMEAWAVQFIYADGKFDGLTISY